MLGQFLTIDVEFEESSSNAIETCMNKIQEAGYLAVFSLLKHENKLSVVHCNVCRTEEKSEEVIKSKDELLFQVCYCYVCVFSVLLV